ncbi:MAG TPA: alanine racemase [Candidatus Limnocylindrales bacterium]|nr:alanine racemase [Candidatus Limnocylindrales bacterium]
MSRSDPIPTVRHEAWIEIDLDALENNAGVLRRAIPAGARLGLLVKANAYGHGLEMAAQAAEAGGADQLVVATVDEGLALRAAGLQTPILVVYPVGPEAIGDAVEAGLELSVSGLGSTRRILDAWTALNERSSPGRRLVLHVEVDSGMGRGGAAPGAVVEVLRRIDSTPATSVAGIWSHLADGSDASRSQAQVGRFEAAIASVAATGRPIPARHLAATDGIFAGSAPAYEMVRVGLGFYGEIGLGLKPTPASAALAAELRPAMTVKARPVRLEAMPAGATVGYGGEWTAERPSIVATLPIGYADGWTRAYWPGAWALLRGRRVPLIGRVSMDAVGVDVTGLVDGGAVTMDEEFVLLGAQGEERIAPNELARLRGSIPNEVFTSFGPRLPRLFLEGDRVVAVTHQADRTERISSEP